MKIVVPEQFDTVREQARRAIAPMKPVDDNMKARKDFLFSAHRAVSAAELPSQHLIYFLLVELLGFRDLGRFEKLAWSIPIDLDGKAFLVEHQKFGVGVFTRSISMSMSSTSPMHRCPSTPRATLASSLVRC
jgi:hypothetical protein